MKDGQILNAESQMSPGKTYSFVWKRSAPHGAMKKVYFSPDKSYVVAVYYRNDGDDPILVERLRNLLGRYTGVLFPESNEAARLRRRQLFCWPSDYVLCNLDGKLRLGIILPFYPAQFCFQNGKGKEFGYFQNCHDRYCILPRQDAESVELSEDWLSCFKMAQQLSRGVRILHQAGLAHTDLSDANVLLDPKTRSVLIIDNDGLAIPHVRSARAQVQGSKGYQAPELVASPETSSPNIDTDRHSLAVMIYRLLLRRDPFGGVLNAEDDSNDTKRYGSDILFCEDPTNQSARYTLSWKQEAWKGYYKDFPHLKTAMAPWENLAKMPYPVLGPYLGQRIEEAFVSGLRLKRPRPTAESWEIALAKTIDLLAPCPNHCKMNWFVFDGIQPARCPYCGTAIRQPYPIALTLERDRRSSSEFEEDIIRSVTGSVTRYRRRIVLWPGKTLFPQHVRNSPPFPTQLEFLSKEQVTPLAQIVQENGRYLLRVLRGVVVCWMKGRERDRRELVEKQRIVLANGLRIQLDGPSSKVLEIQMV